MHGPISYRFRDRLNGDFGRKSQIFPNPVYVAHSLKGFPLELGADAWSQKTRMMGLPGRQRSLTIYSAVWTQCTNVTDGQTPGICKLKPKKPLKT